MELRYDEIYSWRYYVSITLHPIAFTFRVLFVCTLRFKVPERKPSTVSF